MRRPRHLARLRGGAGRREAGADAHGWLEHAGAEVCIVALRGRWDASSTDRGRELLVGVTGWYPTVVLDLSQVTFADSTVLALAIACQAGQRAAGGELRVVVPAGPVGALLDSTGLRDALDVYPSRGEALRARQLA
jgi:anti-anti-sigma factor